MTSILFKMQKPHVVDAELKLDAAAVGLRGECEAGDNPHLKHDVVKGVRRENSEALTCFKTGLILVQRMARNRQGKTDRQVLTVFLVV